MTRSFFLKVVNKRSVYIEQYATDNNFSVPQSWSILSSVEQRIKAKIEEVGTPLMAWDVRINYGIKTGLNEAFIISGQKRRELISLDPKSAEVIRPILRGRDIRRYGFDFSDLWLINIHNGIYNKGIKQIDINDYPAIKQHLDKYYGFLVKRFDKGDTPYNLRSCGYMDDFRKQKIIYAETMRVHKASDSDRFPRFSYSKEEIFLDKTCFMITGDDLNYILPVINSELMRFLIEKNIAVLDTGGYLMQKIYVEQMPIPQVKNKKRIEIEKLAAEVIERRKLGTKSTEIERQIDFLVYDLFDLTSYEVNFLESRKCCI